LKTFTIELDSIDEFPVEDLKVSLTVNDLGNSGSDGVALEGDHMMNVNLRMGTIPVITSVFPIDAPPLPSDEGNVGETDYVLVSGLNFGDVHQVRLKCVFSWVEGSDTDSLELELDATVKDQHTLKCPVAKGTNDAPTEGSLHIRNNAGFRSNFVQFF